MTQIFIQHAVVHIHLHESNLNGDQYINPLVLSQQGAGCSASMPLDRGAGEGRRYAREAPRSSSAPRAQKPGSGFVYVKLPASSWPIDRNEAYANRLHGRLGRNDLGGVCSFRMDSPQPGDIYLQVTSLAPALQLVRQELVTLGAPDGTQLLYVDHGMDLLDDLRCGEWRVRQPNA